jgi:hypothetical protein
VQDRRSASQLWLTAVHLSSVMLQGGGMSDTAAAGSKYADVLSSCA